MGTSLIIMVSGVTAMAEVPVSVHVGDAEGVAVVQQRGVDQCVVLWVIHQPLQVAQVAVAASDAVPRTVLIQDEHLTRTEPTLKTQKEKTLTFFSGHITRQKQNIKALVVGLAHGYNL